MKKSQALNFNCKGRFNHRPFVMCFYDIIDLHSFKKGVLEIHEIMINLRNFWGVCIASCAIPTVEFLFGEHTITKPLLVLFVLLVIIDWVAGRTVANNTGTKSSKYGIDGAKRTAIMFLFLIAGNFVDVMIGTEYPIAFAIALAMVLLPTIESVVANVKLAGWDSHIKIGWLKKISDILSKWVESEIEYKQARIKNRQEEKRDQYETKSD